jgi:hypothetical protein
MRGGGADGERGLDRVARAECRDQLGAGVALVAPQGAENGGDRRVDRGGVDGEVGGGGLGGMGFCPCAAVKAVQDYTPGYGLLSTDVGICTLIWGLGVLGRVGRYTGVAVQTAGLGGRHGSIGCQRKRMVPDTVGTTPETTVESQFPATVSEGDL